MARTVQKKGRDLPCYEVGWCRWSWEGAAHGERTGQNAEEPINQRGRKRSGVRGGVRELGPNKTGKETEDTKCKGLKASEKMRSEGTSEGKF